MKKIPWVKGNTLNLAVPLQLVTVNNGQKTKTDYTPPEGSEIHVYITEQYRKKEYPYTLTGNVVSFKDDGTLKVGCYGIEITVGEPHTEQVDGQNRRTFKYDIEIFDSLNELGTMPDGEIILDAAIFIQGQKGDKGEKGDKGATGPQGQQGEQGEKGDTGNAATIAVGTVTTGEAGSSASVTNSGTSGAAVFDFTIPKGDKGDKGEQGNPGDYTKPASGIPSTDMTAEVQTSLGKADNSLQSITEEELNEIFN